MGTTRGQDAALTLREPPIQTEPPSSVERSVLGRVLLLGVFFGGFINLLTSDGVQPATVLIDVVVALMALDALVRFGRGKASSSGEVWLSLLLLALGVFAALALFGPGDEPAGSRLSTLRSHGLYALVAVYFLARGLPRAELLKLLEWFMRLSAVVAAFGVAQFFLRDSLPTALLVPRETELFGYFASDITRSTGLMGNPIVFGCVMSLAYAMHLSRFCTRPTLPRLLLTAVVLGGCVVTFSRAGMAVCAGATALILVAQAFRRNAGTAIFVAFFAVTLGVPALALIALATGAYDSFQASFIVSKVFGSGDAAVKASTSVHNLYVEVARRVISENPWVGVGVGTQRDGSNYEASGGLVVTDGALWAKTMEGGLLLMVPYVLMLAAVVLRQFCAWREDAAAWWGLGLVAFSVFTFSFASTYNSAFLGKGPFILYWLLFGLTVALARSVDDGEGDAAKG